METKNLKKISSFDQYATKYDTWFMKNRNLLESEVALVAYALGNPGRTLSVGCGSGLFEYLLHENYGITIRIGLEPSEAMADIARKRGMQLIIGTAEETDFGNEIYDTLLFNGTPSYINDLQYTFRKAYNALKPGGKVVVLDVPKEGSFATLYNLAKTLGTWEHELFKGVKPEAVYPIEFVKDANWRTTHEKTKLLEKTGFRDFSFAQTLTRHPFYADEEAEEPKEGYKKGDYVAITAKKGA